jgi:hypothetical protein
MKKLSFVLALGAIFVSSCKKNYNCTCTYQGSGANAGQKGVYVIPNATQQQAATICTGYQAYNSTGTQTLKCSL